MSQNNIEVIQNLLRNFQNVMKEKESTVRGQWNFLTLLEKLSQVQLCRRMNLFGITASNNEVAQLFYYLGIKKNSMDFNDFINLMETDPSSLGPKTRRLSQSKDIEHETLKSYENDYNKYCRRTTTFRSLFTAPGPTRCSYASEQTQKTTTNASRPFTASTAQLPKSSKYNSQYRKSRKQNDVIRANSKRSNPNGDEQYDTYNNQLNNDDQYYSHEDHNCCSGGLGNSGTFSYEPCRTCLDRTLPRDTSTKQMREATLRSFSNTSIQRQEYDGIDVSKVLNRDSGISVISLVRKISDIAYTSNPSSWECFLKWRNPHHDLLDANDLITGLKHDGNLVLCQADAQKIIDKYGGPMNHSTFAVMLHDGSKFNRERPIDDDNIF